MIDLLLVYTCPNCGDILDDQIIRSFNADYEKDEVFIIKTCDKYNHKVREKYLTNEIGEEYQYLEKVDHQRWLRAMGYYD